MPRFNFRLLIGIGTILFGVVGLIAIIMFMVVRFRGGEPPLPGGGGIGALPGIGEGPGGQIREGGEGGLPASGGETPIPTDHYPIGGGTEPAVSDVAQGGKTQAQVVLDSFPIAATVSPSGGLNYYNSTDRKFYHVTADGSSSRLLSDEAFAGVADVEWSPQGDSALIQHLDGTTQWYNFVTKRRAVLPRDVADPGFRADGQSIGYKLDTEDANNNWIVVSAPDGSGARAVQALGENGGQADVQWSPDNSIVALFRKPRGIDREEVFFIGLEGENFQSLDVQGSLFEGKWSPDGGKVLYHTVLAGDAYRPNLWAAEAGSGGVRRQLALGLRTWVDRCVFRRDSRAVYCAAPVDLPEGAGLVEATARGIAYDLWQIDLASGGKELIAIPVREGSEQITDIRGLSLAPDGNSLFIHTLSRVYRIRLK